MRLASPAFRVPRSALRVPHSILRYVAHDLGVQLLSVEVDVTVRLEGYPTLATAAEIAVRVDAADKKTDVEALIERAVAISTVANSLQRGLSITVTH
jgi:organic hydroperoxide reductase OsmC/OhrA